MEDGICSCLEIGCHGFCLTTFFFICKYPNCTIIVNGGLGCDLLFLVCELAESIAGSSRVMCTNERNGNQRSSSHFRNKSKRALDSNRRYTYYHKERCFINAIGFSDNIGSIQHVLVCVSPSGSAFHPGSLFRGSGNGNGGVGQLVDHRGPLCL